jgi:hypothetical protein
MIDSSRCFGGDYRRVLDAFENARSSSLYSFTQCNIYPQLHRPPQCAEDQQSPREEDLSLIG